MTKTTSGRGIVMTDDDKSNRPGTMQTEVTQRKSRGRLGRDVQSKIGQQLRAMYDDVVSAGVPERFTELLLKAPAREVCSQCHAPSTLSSERVPAHMQSDRSCLECHQGHGGKERFFLRATGVGK